MKTKQTTVGWWLEIARANDSRLLQEARSLAIEVKEFREEIDGTKARRNAEIQAALSLGRGAPDPLVRLMNRLIKELTR